MIEYFSHDYNARNDLNIKKLFMGEGLSGLGLYWCIVEMLYENGGYIELGLIPTIAYELRTSEEQINNVITKYDLFSKNKAKFWSDGVLKRLKTRNDKSEKARQNASARWDKNKGQKEECDGNAMAMQWQCDRNANAMQTQCNGNATAMRQECDRNAIKEKKRKEKEIKEENNKEENNKDLNLNKESQESYINGLSGVSVFNEIMKTLEKVVSPISFETFFNGQVKYVGVKTDRLILSAESLTKTAIEGSYRETVVKAIQDASNGLLSGFDWRD